MKKVAVFVDWDNVRKGVFTEAGKRLRYKINYNDTANVIKYINAFIDPGTEEVYRIFFYLTDPYGEIIDGTDYSKTNTYKHATSFIERLSIANHIAIRKGSLVPRGKDVNGNTIFIQKKVDMLLGLDIAHVSYCRLADRILIFSYDTDVVPALKVARINGLQVIFPSCPDVQPDINRELKIHSDIIREVHFGKVFPKP